MKTYDLKFSAISMSAIKDILKTCTDEDRVTDMLEYVLTEISAKNSLSGVNGLSYLDGLLFKEAFKAGYASAHTINHLGEND